MIFHYLSPETLNLSTSIDLTDIKSKSFLAIFKSLFYNLLYIVENANYSEMPDDELKDILSGSIEYDCVPLELRQAADEIIGTKPLRREVVIGFLTLCDEFEQWRITTSGPKRLENFLGIPEGL